MPVLRKKKKKQLTLCSDCGKSSTPAIEAARYGHEDCLIIAYRELGVFNERDNFGATPVHYAARFGQLACLRWLIANSGISANAVSQSGMTAAHDAAALGQLQCLQYLLENTHCSAKDRTLEGATVLHIACKFGRVEVVRWLVEEGGCSPGEKGGNDVTPVHLCAARDQLACLKYLTSHRQYQPNELTVHGATPVYFAAQEGCLESLQWLVLHGQGDPLLPASDGMAPVHAASQAGQLECLQWLVELACVSPRLKSGDGATPVHFAAASGKVACLEWLLNHGAKVSDMDNLGGTPVHDAAEQGHLETLQLLISRGGDVTVADNEGIKPIDLAREHGFEDCVFELFRAAKTNIVTSLVPDPPQVRRSSEDRQARQVKEDRQREFENTLMSEVSEAEREQIWEEAAKEATVPVPGLKLLLESEDLPADSGTSQYEGNKSTRSFHSRKSANRSASYKAVFGSAEPPAKQRLALSPRLFDTPPISNLELAQKQDSKVESKQEVRYSYNEPPDLVDTTEGQVEGQEEDTAEKFEVKEMKQSSSFLRWFSFRKKREPPESEKVGGAPEQKREKKTKFQWGKKKAAHMEAEGNTLELSGQGESKEIGEDAIEKVAESEQPITQEAQESKQIPPKEEAVPAEDKEMDQTVPVPAEDKEMDQTVPVPAEAEQPQSMDISTPPDVPPSPSAEDATEEANRKEPAAESEPLQTPGGAPESEETGTSLSRRSSEKVVIRKGRGSTRTPENAVSVEFIKLRSVYHKQFSDFKDDDFSSPEGSDTEEGTTARRTGTRSRWFERFGVEIQATAQGPSPIPKKLEAEFEASMEPEKEEDTSALNESVLSDVAVPVEVDLNIDFNSKDLLDISLLAKAGSPPASVTEQDSTTDFKTPPTATPSMQLNAEEPVTNIDDIPIVKTPERPVEGPALVRQRSSVKNLAQMFEGSGGTPTTTPLKRMVTPKKFAASGGVSTTTPTTGGGTPNWVASSGGRAAATPTATPSKEATSHLKIASSGDTPTATPTTGDTTPARISALGNILSATPTAMPTEGDTAAEKIASSGDTPTIADTTPKRISATGDILAATPTTEGATPKQAASPVDTPTKMAADEDGDILTPLKRISSTSQQRTSAAIMERDRIDGIPSDDEGGSTQTKLVCTISSPSKAMLSAFVHSADSKHLNVIKSQHDTDQANLADRVAQELMEVPTPNDEIEAGMQKHVLGGVLQPKVYLVRGSQLKELSAQEKFEQGKDYICLQVECGYPPQAHVFLFTSKMEPPQRSVTLIKKVIRSLPGRPILYREVLGHESALFSAHFSSWFARKHKSKTYLNLCVPGGVQLYRYSDGRFQEEAFNYFSLTEGEVFVLDTPLMIYIRVIPSMWSEDAPINLFKVAMEFLTRQEYPEWASIAMVTKYGEPQAFVSLFPTWPHPDLRLATMATELSLPEELEAVRYSSAGRVKIWKLEGNSKALVPLEEFGHFYASHCYLTECIHDNHHQLFLWIGSGVSFNALNRDVMDQMTKHRSNIKGTSQLVIIPEGKETDQYLNVFKGKLIIHNPPVEGSKRLFRVSGTSALRMCIREVPPQATSLHSSHTFIAYTVEELYVWSGQFSPPHERRGALVVVRMLDPDFLEPTALLTEGKETEDFWSAISGRGPHPFLDAAELPDYAPGRLYSYKDCEFKERFNYTKDVLGAKEVFVLWKNDLVFIWRGKQAKPVLPLDVATDFTTKVYSSKSAIRDLVVSCEEQGSESQDFWSVFSLAERAIAQVHSPPKPKADASGAAAVVESLHKEEGGSDGGPLEVGKEREERDGHSATPSFSNLFESDVSVTIVSEGSRALKKKLQKERNMVTVPVRNHRGEQLLVCVSAQATVVSVLLKLATMLKVEVSRDLALFEVMESLGIERQVEDHETIGDVVATWPKKNYGYFIIREVYGKHKLWTRPTLPKSDISNFISQGQVPPLYASFAHRKLIGAKWKQETVTLDQDGIYTVVLSGQGSHRGGLVCGLVGYQLCMPGQVTGKERTGITHYCFALKPTNSFKSRDVVLFSAGDEDTLKMWVEAIRLVKYGSQLKANYHAMLQALDNHDKDHSVGVALATEVATPLPEEASKQLEHYKLDTTDL